MKETTTNGTIKYPERAKQLLLFEGLIDDDKMCPSDIDGCFEYKNYAWIFYEVKRQGTEVGLGQRLMLERLVENAVAADKHALIIVAEHDVEDANQPVELKDCIIRETKFDSDPWIPRGRRTTVKEMTNSFIERMNAWMAEDGMKVPKGRTT